MSEENNEITEGHSDYKPADSHNESIKHQLTGMYQNWFLDYASYVILERAVPHINDGLKPVQRRILHSMKRMDDGRYNKVANIVGHTMQFHPHGDASIGDALVQLGQKDLLVDCQGNWGNILTGDGAAAPRYIEARLSKFALDVVFNPKTTEWKLSYDGRNKEPITLPVKFPLLLAQGVEGIAVGLSSKILPHNFNELCDASISYLRNEEFKLYPDFQTGGSTPPPSQARAEARVRVRPLAGFAACGHVLGVCVLKPPSALVAHALGEVIVVWQGAEAPASLGAHDLAAIRLEACGSLRLHAPEQLTIAVAALRQVAVQRAAADAGGRGDLGQLVIAALVHADGVGQGAGVDLRLAARMPGLRPMTLPALVDPHDGGGMLEECPVLLL